jgi:hypothetical protein
LHFALPQFSAAHLVLFRKHDNSTVTANNGKTYLSSFMSLGSEVHFFNTVAQLYGKREGWAELLASLFAAKIINGLEKRNEVCLHTKSWDGGNETDETFRPNSLYIK